MKKGWKILGEFLNLRGQIKMSIFLEKEIRNTDGRQYGPISLRNVLCYNI